MIKNNLEIYIPELNICNYGAVVNMVKKCGGVPILTSKPEDLLSANKIILAGVGSYDKGVEVLKNGGWFDIIKELALNNKITVLGICLGMQLLCRQSEEGIQK